MRAVIQRVSGASVKVDGQVVGQIGAGLLVLLGVARGDTIDDAVYLAEKVVGLRIFADDDGKMNRCLTDGAAQMLVVSQFTLLGDARRGRRPSFIQAAEPELGRQLYERFVEAVADHGVTVATGSFQSEMEVTLTNSGPVTILLDSRKAF
jgi:D-tyrosyl-tRNA(Tyr) deacylase